MLKKSKGLLSSHMMTAAALTWDRTTKSGMIMPVTASFTSVQSVYRRDNGSMTTNGPMGEGMLISIQTAVTLARLAVAERLGEMPRVDIRVSVPDTEGVMYDGTSAGLAIYVAVLGALMGWSSAPHAAFTGEVWEDGTVNKVGNMLQKILMALENDIDMVMVPSGNAADLIVRGGESALSMIGVTMTILGVAHVSDLISIGDRDADIQKVTGDDPRGSRALHDTENV